MKVEICEVGTTNYRTLFDEGDQTAALSPPVPAAAGVLAEWSPSWDGARHEEDTYAGLYGTKPKFRKPRGNLTVTATLAFNVQYSTRSDALQSIRTYKTALMDKLMHVKVTEAGTVDYYPNALIRYGAKQTGSAIDHTVAFTSDDSQTTAP